MRVFEPFKLNTITLANRFVRSATHCGCADKDGFATEQNKDLLFSLAENEVGLIISGYMFISKEGKGAIGQLGIYNDESIKELFQITRYIHKHTPSKIFAQLVHCGAQGSKKISGWQPKGPCEMDISDIERVIDDFSSAAIRAKEAGFDGVQIHAAHGYLISEFLSKHFNKREDNWGQTNHGRAMILLNTIEHVRKKVGKKFPIILKLNCDDFLDDGLKNEDCLEILGHLENSSLDCVEISGGTMSSKPSPVRAIDPKDESEQFYYRDFCKILREKSEIPLIAMGGIRDISVADNILKNKKADLIGMSRPFICEPNFIKRWSDGDLTRAKCISCNRCFKPLLVGKGLSCVKFNS